HSSPHVHPRQSTIDSPPSSPSHTSSPSSCQICGSVEYFLSAKYGGELIEQLIEPSGMSGSTASALPVMTSHLRPPIMSSCKGTVALKIISFADYRPALSTSH